MSMRKYFYKWMLCPKCKKHLYYQPLDVRTFLTKCKYCGYKKGDVID